MKYEKHIIDKILNALADGQGRVRACKIAGIEYQTFMNWYNSKVEFFEAVKKAEEVGYDKIRDVCERKIIEDRMWQAAAWFLERKFPEKYGKIETLKYKDEGGLLPKHLELKDLSGDDDSDNASVEND
jgi:hypothetical protein